MKALLIAALVVAAAGTLSVVADDASALPRPCNVDRTDIEASCDKGRYTECFVVGLNGNDLCVEP